MAISEPVIVWRRERDSNPRCAVAHCGFQDRRFQPNSAIPPRVTSSLEQFCPQRCQRRRQYHESGQGYKPHGPYAPNLDIWLRWRRWRFWQFLSHDSSVGRKYAPVAVHNGQLGPLFDKAGVRHCSAQKNAQIGHSGQSEGEVVPRARLERAFPDPEPGVLPTGRPRIFLDFWVETPTGYFFPDPVVRLLPKGIAWAVGARCF